MIRLFRTVTQTRFFSTVHPFTAEDRAEYKRMRGQTRCTDLEVNQKFPPLERTAPANDKSRRAGLLGYKIGMTHIFNKWGLMVTQVKTPEKHGFYAIQVGAGEKALKNMKKPQIGHLAKAGVGPKANFTEFKISEDSLLPLGYQLSVLHFRPGQWVDVQSISKGKGFQGTIKRWNFSGQPRSHGNSKAHRKPGSIGQREFPGRVFKGKKMAGRMGGKKTTTQSLKVVRCDTERSLLYIKGAVPGWITGVVRIQDAIKRIHRQFRTLYYPTYIHPEGQEYPRIVDMDAGEEDPFEQFPHDNDEVAGPDEKDDDE